MNRAVLALVGLALTAAAPASKAHRVRPAHAPRPAPAAAKGASAKSPLPTAMSAAPSRVAAWIAASHDNGALPYIVIDKQGAELFLFDAHGKPHGAAPVLIGMGVGDEASPGVGSKNLAQIGPAERTTPAGRFVARFGKAAGGERVLWVDYADSVALHPVIKGTKQERRAARLASPTPDDNRITFGCINVPIPFYNRNVQPLFRRKGGVVYILPDTKTLEEVFPRLRVQPFLDRTSS